MNIWTDKYDKYIRFFRFILKYWNSNIFNATEYGDMDGSEGQDFDHSPEELVEDLKKMGPTYIKLGQLLSTRPDMLPEPYLKALATLQDEVNPVPFKDIKGLFKKEMGDDISEVFDSFDTEPIASASIGQVYRAVLPSGEEVAVKIQRPDIHKHFVEDLNTLMNLSEKAESLNGNLRSLSIHAIIEELQYILMQELDYYREALNLITLKKNMKEFDALQVPAVFRKYCSRRVLTMEYIHGQKVTALSSARLDDLPKKKLANQFVKGYLKQIIVDGFAHADPHPGNVHITESGKLALLDLGMTVRFTDKMREKILKLMIALGAGDGEQVTKVLLGISDFDDDQAEVEVFERQVVRKMQENQNREAAQLQTGRSILEINKIAIQQEIKLPVELVSLGKILLNMDQIIAILSPEHKLQKTVKKYIEHLMQYRMLNELKSGHFFQNLLESKELIQNLPYRLNKISDDLAKHKFKIKMDVIDERRFILAFQKVANRITAGVVVAALILGAALIMRIPTAWTLWGYPAFAVLLFIFAALIGLYLIYEILFKDENNPK